MWEDMEAASWLQLAMAIPCSLYWLTWYVRRWDGGGRWRWWQKPLIGYVSLIMLAMPFRVASVPFGAALTGNPEVEPVFAIGSMLVLGGFLLWCLSAHFRAALAWLLAERRID